MERMRRLLPGVVFVFLLSLLSNVLNRWLSPWIQLEALTIGILLGMILGGLTRIPSSMNEGVCFCLKKLLKAGIVLLGFKLSFVAMLNLGPRLILLVVVFVPTVLALAMFLGKLMRMDRHLATLIGVGSCVCGASAIVAVAPCIDADDGDSILAVSVISFLGAIGVLLYSAVAVFSGMTDLQYGIWSGLSLQGVAHALAAAFARGDAAGEIGTFVKMTRVLMLVGVSLALSWIFNGGRSSGTRRASFPLYVLGFVAAGIVATTGWLPEGVVKFLSSASSLFILMAMISMGLLVDFRDVWKRGLSALACGSILFTIISSGTYLVISTFF